MSSPSRRKEPVAGFTLVELMMALVVTALVMTALASGLTAAARAWQDGDAAAAATQYSARALEPMRRMLANALCLGTVVPTANGNVPASVTFWRADDFPASFATNTVANPDGRVQFGEVSVIAYDAANKQIVLYQAVPFSAGSATGATNNPYAALSSSAFAGLGGSSSCCMRLSDLTAGNAAANFTSVLTSLSSSGVSAAAIPLVKHVTACRFAAVNPDSISTPPTYTTRPQLDYVITITPMAGDGYTGGMASSVGNVIYGSIVLRGATTQPVNW